MANGDRLSGAVLRMVGGKLVLDPEYADVLELDWEKVAGVSLEEPVPAVLEDGTTVELRELPTEDVALSDVVALASPPTPPPSVEWEGRVDFGWAHAKGNRNTQLGTLTALARREDPARYRLSLLLDGAHGSNEGEETADRARVEGKLDRRADQSSYRYFVAGAGYDRVRELGLRVEVGTGVGRTLADRPGHLLTVEVGASWVRDRFEAGKTEADAKLRIGETWERQLGSGKSLSQTLALLSAADEMGDYTGEFVLALTNALTDRVSLTTRLVDTYDSRPAPGTKRNDFTLATQLGLAFGN